MKQLIVAGVDEAGRGPLAGPVVTAAVILKAPIEGVTDSKKLSEKKSGSVTNLAIVTHYSKQDVKLAELILSSSMLMKC